ncbi:MAG TPA: YceI family protein [Gemmatimonadaceae bacterium]|nr:YceI family protein [Gemmatimonadaceae bacterium]
MSIRYRIDVRASQFTIRAFAAGMLSALAHNPTFAVRQYEGEVTVDPETGAEASLALTIAASSLELVGDVSSRDREEVERIMREQVLDTSTYPTITYDSSASVTSAVRKGDGQLEIALGGSLKLHGCTHRQPITARAIVTASSLRAFGEFRIRQTDYGIRLVTAAAGTIKIKDELKCSFDIVANVSGDSR